MSYIRQFASRDEAWDWMRIKNRARRDVERETFYVLVDGPEDDYAVVDMATALDLDVRCEWAV